MRKLLIIVVLLVLVTLAVSPAAAQTGRQVYAFYFGWWTSESWADGRLIDRPAQPYDSRDAGALGRHIDEARGAGIDAFVVSWFGPKNNNLTHTTFNALLDQAAARGFKIGAAVDMHEGGYNATVAEVTESLATLINDRANHPAYLRYNGKPVIYFWNQARFSVSQWQQIRAQVDPNRSTIWVAEGLETGFLPTFDGLYLFNSAWAGDPAGVHSGWRFNTEQAGGWFYTPSVHPGWDESRMSGRSNPTAPQARQGGEFLANSWNGAVASGASVIIIVSWNEYFENSHIEPSQQHGSVALDTLRPLIANWKAGGGATMAPPAAAAPVTAPSGPVTTVLSPTVSLLNVRSGGSLDDGIIGQISPAQSFAVTGDTGGWYSIDFNGQTGWVFGELVRVYEGQVSGGAAGAVASANAPVAAPPSGPTYTLRFNMRLRDNPGEAAITLDSIFFGTVLPVVGRNAQGTWLQVSFNGQTGWVANDFGTLNVSLDQIPVTYGS